MKTILAVAAATLLGSASAQSQAVEYKDPETGITFSSITHANGVSYRVALPTSPSNDAIVQIVSPQDFQWCGLAWGGHMTQNPLSVAWPTGASTGQQSIISNRIAYGYSAVPEQYDDAEHTYLKGTSSNATHWQVTARCQGCTRWSSADGDFNIDAENDAIFAYACSSVAPATPSSNTSQFNIHEQFGIWSHDLSFGKSANFAEYLENNAATEVAAVERRWTA